MKKILVLAVFLAATSAFAAAGDAIRLTLRALDGSEAQFTQKFTPKGFRQAQVETGSVLFGSVPQMRWTYRVPEAKIFVFDGRTSWFYVPGEKQVTVNHLTQEERAALPFFVLADATASNRDYAVTERATRDGIVTSFKGRTPKVAVPDIVVTTGARDRTLRRIEYADRQGNRTIFEFSGFRKTAVQRGAFEFVAPAGVQVIEN